MPLPWAKKSTRAKNAESTTGVGRSGSSLIRKLPWIEAIGTALGVVTLHFVFHKDELAELFAIAGALVTLGRLGYTAELEKSIAELREPLDRIREYFDVSAQAHFAVFRDMLQVYGKITEAEFSRVKDGILADARSRLLDLANDKKSVVLPTTTYYGRLLPMIEKAIPPERIWALSMMRELEWTDSQPERNFIEFSKAAAQRGVPIDRVFVMGRDIVTIAVDNSAIKLHLHSEEPSKLRGFVVDEEVVRRDDEELHSKLGDGFIAFGERVALVDVFSGKSARGYVTMNPVEIARLQEVYDRLLILAEPLDFYIARRAREAEAARATGTIAAPAQLAGAIPTASRQITSGSPKPGPTGMA